MSRRLKKYWTGKSVLITGASSGLGWALVEVLAPYEIHFGLMSRRREKLEELAKKLDGRGSKFTICPCDVRHREEVEKAVADFHQTAGRIDVAWVNSGISKISSYAEWDWDLVEAMLDTNLKGAIYTTKACLDVMVPQKSGAVVGIGSAASMRGMPTRGIYSTTKIGLQYMFESLAVELPEIQFTTIHPGYVDTPLNRGNPNRMWLLEQDRAAQLMIQAVAKKKHIYIYPWQMRLLYKLIRGLPWFLFRRLAKKLIHLSNPAPQQKKLDEPDS